MGLSQIKPYSARLLRLFAHTHYERLTLFVHNHKFDAPHAVGTPCVSVDGFEGSTDDANKTDDFVEDTLDDGPHDRLPPNA